MFFIQTSEQIKTKSSFLFARLIHVTVFLTCVCPHGLSLTKYACTCICNLNESYLKCLSWNRPPSSLFFKPSSSKSIPLRKRVYISWFIFINISWYHNFYSLQSIIVSTNVTTCNAAFFNRNVNLYRMSDLQETE